jgi:hypothetical protein
MEGDGTETYVMETGYSVLSRFFVPLACCLEHNNEPSNLVKVGEFIYKPNDCRIVKENSMEFFIQLVS